MEFPCHECSWRRSDEMVIAWIKGLDRTAACIPHQMWTWDLVEMTAKTDGQIVIIYKEASCRTD
jgi:hypothetical protein